MLTKTQANGFDYGNHTHLTELRCEVQVVHQITEGVSQEDDRNSETVVIRFTGCTGKCPRTELGHKC